MPWTTRTTGPSPRSTYSIRPNTVSTVRWSSAVSLRLAASMSRRYRLNMFIEGLLSLGRVLRPDHRLRRPAEPQDRADQRRVDSFDEEEPGREIHDHQQERSG